CSSSQGGGDELATESAGGGTAFRPSGSAAGSSVAAGTAPTEATPVRAALTANAAAAPTAALPINSRRESIAHPLLRNERNPPHGSPSAAPTCRTGVLRCYPPSSPLPRPERPGTRTTGLGGCPVPPHAA